MTEIWPGDHIVTGLLLNSEIYATTSKALMDSKLQNYTSHNLGLQILYFKCPNGSLVILYMECTEQTKLACCGHNQSCSGPSGVYNQLLNTYLFELSQGQKYSETSL